MKPGDILVLICRGPMGAGMEEIYQITSALKYLDFGKHIAVLTDARFSGVSTGACIGHVSPEALAGGPIGKLRDGDLIEIVIDRVKLEGSVNLVGCGGRVFDAEEGARDSGGARAAAGPRARPRAARRNAPVGGAAERQRRHLGRLRFRHGRYRQNALEYALIVGYSTSINRCGRWLRYWCRYSEGVLPPCSRPKRGWSGR